MKNRNYQIILFILATLSISNITIAAKLKKNDYIKNKTEKSVVLFDVNWGRKWACGQFENAQLLSLTFEKLGVAVEKHNKYSKIELKTPSRAFAKLNFKNYGFLVEPGEYAFSGWAVKAAKSTTDVGTFKATRRDLVTGEVNFGGTFEVQKDEIIFIGNFFLDCYQSPIPWRYYPDGKEAFEFLKEEYSNKYKFIDKDKIQFRLLKTSNFGQPYELQ